MACIAGDPRPRDTGPDPWFDYDREGGFTERKGRVCSPRDSRTNRLTPGGMVRPTAEWCHGCILFRGKDPYGKLHNGLQPDPEDPEGAPIPRALREWEHRAYQRWVDTTGEDEDVREAAWAKFWRFIRPDDDEPGISLLRSHPEYIDDEEVLEKVHAYGREQVARWREAHPEEARRQTREAVRRLRAKRRAAVSIPADPPRDLYRERKPENAVNARLQPRGSFPRAHVRED